jgi:N-acetylglucosamine kinase-like BadF-type ATPase
VILGVDQGSSYTRALLSDEHGRLLALGVAPGACHAYVGMDEAMRNVRQAALSALRQVDYSPASVHILFGGFTGADWEDEYPLLHRNVTALGLAEEVTIVNDSIIALRGATEAGYGAIIIAGSGGNCAVRAPDGREFIYGYFQEARLQGGGALGRELLEAVYRAHTGRQPATLLTNMALKVQQMPDVPALLRADVENRLPLAIKDMAPLVFEAACQDDRTAAGILTRFGEGLAELVVAGLRRFEMLALPVEVALSGSVFKGPGGLLQTVICQQILRSAPRARLVQARYEPVVGAVLLGLEQANGSIKLEDKENIEKSSQRLGLIRFK